MNRLGQHQQFDLTTLPRVLTHSQMSGLGACAWYSPWDCYTPENISRAQQELEDAHNWVLDFANAAQSFYDDAVSAGDAPPQVITALRSSVDDSINLVRQHTQVMNEFYSKTGLSGLGNMGQGKVELHPNYGLGWVVGLSALSPLLIAVSRIFVWTYISSIVGRIADLFKGNSDIAREKMKATGDYYIAWRQAKEAGTTPPEPPADLGIGTAYGDWQMIALYGGIGLLALFLLMRK